MTLGESFTALFDSISILTICLWAAGFILFCVEFFQPMRGLAYVTGVMLIVASFVTKMLYGSPGEAFMYVLLTSVLLFAVHIVSLGTHKRVWLRVARLSAPDVAVPNGPHEGSVGTASTPIDGTGSITIDDTTLVVYSDKPIAQGARVRITKLMPDKIIVEGLDSDDM